MIATLVMVLCATTIFANKARFYDQGKLVDTMYVDSPEGLRAREMPTLSASKICGLQHRLPVKVVAVGDEVTIDGIKDPWVKILLPRCHWEKDTPTYGWVFGGYLSKSQPKFQAPETKWELEKYLSAFTWFEWPKDECQSYMFRFSSETNRFHRGKPESGIGEGGTWKATSKDTVSFHTNYIMEEEYDDSWDIKFRFRNDGTPYYDGYSSIYYLYPNMEYYTDDVGAYFFNRKGNIICYYMEKEWSTYASVTREEKIMELIKIGISAEGTPWEEDYHQYWDPIMKEHQEKFDRSGM